MNFEPEPPEEPRDLTSRAVNAALLNRETFRGVVDDDGASKQAYTLVAASAVASAVGTIDDPASAVANAVLVVVGWLIYAHSAAFLRSVIFPSIHAEASRQNMMRVVGIAYGPTLLRAFGFIPVVGGVIWLASSVWLLVAIAVGFRTTLAFENYWPAAGILVIGALLNGVISLILFAAV